MDLAVSLLFPRRSVLAAALSAALGATAAQAAAQDTRLVADGTDEVAAAGHYASSADGNDGHVLHALNGGRITAAGRLDVLARGQGASGLRADQGGSIVLADASVMTLGNNAAALLAGQGSRIDAISTDGTHITLATQGASSYAVHADGGRVAVAGATLTTTGSFAAGVRVSNGGEVDLRALSIQTQGADATGIHVQAGTAHAADVQVSTQGAWVSALRVDQGHLSGTGVAVNTHGLGAAAATARAGAVVQLSDSHLATHGQSAHALTGSGELVLRDTDIVVTGRIARIATLTGGSLHMVGGSVRAESSDGRGIHTAGNTQVRLEGTRVDVGDYAFNINGAHDQVTLDDVDILTHGPVGRGIWMPDESSLVMRGGSLSTAGAGGVAIDNRAGQATLQNVRVETVGGSAHALYASGDTGRAPPVISAENAQLTTHGYNSIGVLARVGGHLTLRDSTLATYGVNAHGVLAGGDGVVALHGTAVTTRGEGAAAAVVNDMGHLDIEGGSLVSERGAAVWLRSARHVAARNGAQLHGGNGVLLQVDAAASPLTLLFDQDVQAVGNIVATAPGTHAPPSDDRGPQLVLRGRSNWRGASTLLGSVTLEDDSRWVLTGDSHVGRLALGSSQVQLSEGHADRFHRLTVEGDLHLDNGLLVFNAQLGDDGSHGDLLHVRGDATGQGAVKVNNVGGAGGVTGNGIRLIQIDGRSDADFVLLGRAVAGSHEYFLHKGGATTPGDGHWYLRSALSAEPDPCAANPDDPGCTPEPPPADDCTSNPALPGCGVGPTLPQPCEVDTRDTCDAPPPPSVLRPEAGAYLANQRAQVDMFGLQRSDREGGHGAPVGTTGVRGWARVQGSALRLGSGHGQLQQRGDRHLMQAGVERSLGAEGQGWLGAMLGAGRASATSTSRLTGFAARSTVTGRATGVYGGWSGEHAYVDGWVQHARFGNQVAGDALATEHYDNALLQTSIEVGHRFEFGRPSGIRFNLQPEAQLVYTHAHGWRHVEHNGTVVQGVNEGGLSARLGLRLQADAWQLASATVSPFVVLNGYRDRAAQGIALDRQRLRQSGAQRAVELAAGARVDVANGWSGWGSLGVGRSGQGLHQTELQVGAARRW